MSRVLLDYPHRVAGHCGSGALRDLLEWNNLGWSGPPDEGLVFGLGGALGFCYLRVPGFSPPVYLVGRGGDLELDLLHRLGATVQLRRTDDPELGWNWVKGELDEGRPVMVWADIGELPYLRVRLPMSRHDIVIIGYDDWAQLAYVVDNDRDGVQEVPYEALARARASTAFPEPTRHATFLVNWPRKLPDLTSAAADAFAASARSLRDGGTDPIGLAKLAPGSVADTGLGGIRGFAHDVEQWPDLFSEPELARALRALPALVEKAGTGGGLFRRLQASCCNQIADCTGSTRTAAAAKAFRQSADMWSALARIATTDNCAAERARGVARVAWLLVELEDAAVTALAAAAEDLV